jgi:alpha-L-fucosidase
MAFMRIGPSGTTTFPLRRHPMNRAAKLFLCLLIFPAAGFPQKHVIDPDMIAPKMEWFADAKLGIFIHWGIYAVNGIGESWSFHNREISHADYMKQLQGFTARHYDPAAWATLIKKTGARYAVVTSKHHDGVALWNTALGDLSVPKRTPARRDVLTPLVRALRDRNLKVGLYFSLIDWSHPDYPGFLKDSARYDAGKDTLRWAKFRNFYQGQIRELMAEFHPDLYWFDGDWEHSAAEWESDKVRTMILSSHPSAIINGRLQGYGDYDTPEQNFPVSRPALRWWELCMTINDSWGYQGRDTHWKTPYQIITIFADAVGMGGNLLLDIGPKEDGTIPDEQAHVLSELGNWANKHAEAIFGTRAGMPQGHFYGPSTISKDSTTLYLFLPSQSIGTVVVKGLINTIKSVTVVGANQPAMPTIVGKISWSHVPGLVYIDVPREAQDQYMTVLKLQLDKPLSLYRGRGGFN